MNVFTTRVLLVACMAAALSFFSGCGPKPVEPYNQKNGAAKSESAGLVDDTPFAEDVVAGDIAGENALVDSLPEGPAGQGPAVEPLTSGSEKNDSTFAGDDKSDDYKRKNGRSSPQMKSVFFDFDQSLIRNDQVSRMEANGQYMKSNPAAKVVVEGNCDEQGSNEYNLALGERRAGAAKKYLLDLGVKASRIRTVSFGEERPLFPGSEEADYELNRRADFVLE